jgi:hypothetical protein
VVLVVAESAEALARADGLLPDLRRIAGEGRRVMVCFDRRGAPALFADARARPATCPPPSSSRSPALTTDP